MKEISSTDALLLFRGWCDEEATLFVNTLKSDGEHRAFTAQIFEVLVNSQTLMARSGSVELAFPLEGAKFFLSDERDTDKPEGGRELFLQCDWPSGNRVVFSLPES